MNRVQGILFFIKEINQMNEWWMNLFSQTGLQLHMTLKKQLNTHTCELCRAPTMYCVSHIMFGADNNGKYHQYSNSISTIKKAWTIIYAYFPNYTIISLTPSKRCYIWPNVIIVYINCRKIHTFSWKKSQDMKIIHN